MRLEFLTYLRLGRFWPFWGFKMFKDIDDKILVIVAVWSLLVLAMVVIHDPDLVKELLMFGLGGLFGMAVGKALAK